MRLRTASLAEYALISRKRIARKPESLSFSQAAANQGGKPETVSLEQSELYARSTRRNLGSANEHL